ncbi:MAG TPA: carboxypeptidase-like regulatory domain-containing protein, partial [Granulicella sp.]|nr:carboxypeptidase-like regulatory domain-containing protein [Granulicella sp.]
MKKNHNIVSRVENNSIKLRAEDGSQVPDQQSAFREFVLIPFSFLGAVLLLILLMSHSALAQAGSGRLAGSVKDATGAVIPRSTVSLLNTATGVNQNTTSGDDGTFNFPVVSIGQYELDVTADGFNKFRQTAGLKIDVNTALTLDVVLQVADAGQTVDVTENTAEVHTTDTQIGQTIES